MNQKRLQIALIDKNGAAFGKIVEINSQNEEYSIKISDLKTGKNCNFTKAISYFPAVLF
jgi:hypothetical protein